MEVVDGLAGGDERGVSGPTLFASTVQGFLGSCLVCLRLRECLFRASEVRFEASSHGLLVLGVLPALSLLLAHQPGSLCFWWVPRLDCRTRPSDCGLGRSDRLDASQRLETSRLERIRQSARMTRCAGRERNGLEHPRKTICIWTRSFG